MTLSGTNLDTVNSIKWFEQGVAIATWTKQANGSWLSSNGPTVIVSQSVGSLGVQPTLVALADTWTGSRAWTVTVSNGSVDSSQNFTVNR